MSLKIPYDALANVMGLPADRLYGASLQLAAGDQEGAFANPKTLAVLFTYVHLVLYCAPEIAMATVARIVLKGGDLQAIMVADRLFLIVNGDQAWSLRTATEVSFDKIEMPGEQHGLDLEIMSSRLIEAAHHLEHQRAARQRMSVGREAPAAVAEGAAPATAAGPPDPELSQQAP
jgi:hypothetical protein